MKASDAVYFKSNSVQNGWRPLLSLGVQEVPADENYPACTAVVAVTLFGEHYYFEPNSEVKAIDDDMMAEAVRIKDEYLDN